MGSNSIDRVWYMAKMKITYHFFAIAVTAIEWHCSINRRVNSPLTIREMLGRFGAKFMSTMLMDMIGVLSNSRLIGNWR